MEHTITFGVLLQSGKRFGDRSQEFITQAASLRVVPTARFVEILLGVGPYQDAPRHTAGLDRSCWSTSRHGAPGFPSRSKSARASSSIFLSAAPSPGPRTRSSS